MKKRIWSLILVLMMVMSMAGCGNKDTNASLTDILKKTETMKTGAGFTEFSIKADIGESVDSTNELMATGAQQVAKLLKDGIYIKVDYTMESMDKMQVACSYKLKEGDVYTKLTEFIICDKAMYIDIKHLVEALKQMIPEFQIYSAFIPTEAEYIKITVEDLKQIGSMTDQIDTSQITDLMGDLSEFKEQQELSNLILKIVSQYFDDAVKEVKPAIITGDDENVTIKITDENLMDTVKALKETDITKYVDQFIEEAGKLELAKTMVDGMKTEKDTVVSNYKEALEGLENGLKDAKDENVKFNIQYSIEVTGEEGNRKENIAFNGIMKDDKNSIEASFKTKVDEKIDEKVTAPTASISLMDLLLKIGMGAQNN